MVEAGKLDMSLGIFKAMPDVRRKPFFRFSLMVARADKDGIQPRRTTTWSALDGETLISLSPGHPHQQLIDKQLHCHVGGTRRCALRSALMRFASHLKTITHAPKKDVGVTVVVRHDTVPEQSDIKVIDRPKTQRERYNVRDVPSGSWPILIDRGIKAESRTN